MAVVPVDEVVFLFRDNALTKRSPITLLSWFGGFSSLKNKLLYVGNKLQQH